MKGDCELSQSPQVASCWRVLGRITPQVFEGLMGVEKSTFVKQRQRIPE